MTVSRTKHLITPVDRNVSFAPRALGRFEHGLHTSPLFENASLARLLDDYPREDLNITTMGRDSEHGAWREGRVPDIAGIDVLRAIERGHLWLNIKYLDRHSADFAGLLAELYDELASAQGGVRPPRWRAATLLVSSPRAYVQYHADSVPNILWHIRGCKQVFVYPHQDRRFASADEIERICSGEQDENLTYRREFENAAQRVVLEPGQAVMWPQNAPHRVENLSGMNVSLSTEHLTRESRRQVQVHRANRLLRRIHIQPRSSTTRGITVPAKTCLALAYRGMRKLKRSPRVTFRWPCTFRVDPSSPTGFVDEESK